MIQLTIDLPVPAAVGRADFLVSGCNAAALGWIERWPDWPARAVVLHGPAGSGKSHLAQLWRERAAARLISGTALTAEGSPPPFAGAGGNVAIDDAERAPETALLHLYNAAIESGGNVLIVSARSPASWAIALPDLASRLRALPAAGIAAPDDALLAAVLVKHFADRQLRVAPGLIAYLLRRIERSFAAAAAIAAQLDKLGLRERGPITVPLARRLLDDRDGQALSDFAVT